MKPTQSPAPLNQIPWHLFEVWQVAALLKVDPATGLDAAQAQTRLDRYGPNRIRERKRHNPLTLFFNQFADFMILILITAAVISGLVGDLADTVVILIIVVLNALIGFVQELRAERAMAALKKLSGQSAQALRDGIWQSVAAKQLVPGDVLKLEAGNIVPADLRLLDAMRLTIDEAALTGESQPSGKTIDWIREPDVPLADRANLAFRGTTVATGHGIGIVTATGMATELGKIAELMSQEKPSKTPLQQRLTRFGHRLAVLVLVICAVIFAVGLVRGEPPLLMFMTAISLAVAAIPEALPAVATVSLALGAKRLVHNKALIRRLPAVETLGSVTFICSDKTGTLTQNRMRADAFFVNKRCFNQVDESFPGLFFQALALNNDVRPDPEGKLLGDPTEIALYDAAASAGFVGLELALASPRLDEIPFDSERKYMATLHDGLGGQIVYIKGAPESVLPLCASQWHVDGIQDIDVEAILSIAHTMAAQGLRVLALACRDTIDPQLKNLEPGLIETGCCFLGLVGLLDPPRPEASAAVRLCKSAGITPVLITGDHPATAQAIALKLGIADPADQIITGAELDQLDANALSRQIQATRIYARVSPEQKIQIVRALQNQGEFVAMTGDGVNDAPALTAADIGVAMGKIGTDVAREAADMVLLDDNFATMVAAIQEGRRIFDNIRKFIKYAMTCNSAEIWTLFLAPCFGLPIPLLPIHILWINLVTDGLPGLALAVEPAEKGIMQRHPRPPHESILAQGMWQHILWIGLLMAGASLFAQGWAYHNGSAHWQSMVFTVLSLSQMGHVLAIRSESQAFYQRNPFSNLPLMGAVLLTIGLQLAVLYLPALQQIFKTQALDGNELLICLALSSLTFIAVEIEQWLRRKGLIYKASKPKP